MNVIIHSAYKDKSENSGKDMGLEGERVVSSGGVIFRVVDGSFKVALISRGRIWGLPKGLIEEGETAKDAALREVKEETGLDGETVGKIGVINYDFFRGKRYFKTVHFFLLKYVCGSVSHHDFEADEVKWFSISEALEILTYVNEKRILKKAGEMLKGENNRWLS